MEIARIARVDRAERHARRRTMKKHREAFVGLDTAKSKHALAVAEGERELVRTLNLYKIIVHRG